ncbi:MAG: YidC/Oxa1 family membrane protein insertase [Spirochaetia bacterium]|nr:YidC/Oxa1 family membrane protein insertase [Spirochaetia bacterium]
MILLKPFEILLASVFSLSVSITNNYGIALILMSFFITLITTPIYFLADRWADEEKKIQDEMRPEIDSVKAVYDGQKQFYLIQTIHRIHGYKFFYSFRSMLGILFQIPFFFSAYNVLSAQTVFSGISFAFVSDLGKPDGLLWGINLLPALMTLVNMISALFFSKSLKVKDNLQAFVLALFFFIFLYSSPSALLIYWTMNNIFSLLKSIIKTRKVKFSLMGKDDKLLISSFLKTYGVFFAIYILSFSLNAFSHYRKYILLLYCFPFGFIFLVSLLRKKVSSGFIVRHSFSLLCLFFSVVLYLMNARLSYFKDVIFLVLIISVTYLLYILVKPQKRFEILNNTLTTKDSLLIILLGIFLFTVVLPLSVYASNPLEITNSPLKLVSVGVVLFLISCVVIISLRNKTKIINTIVLLISFALLFYLFNYVLLPVNGLTVQGFELANVNLIAAKLSYFIRDLGILFLVVLTFFLLTRKKQVLFIYLSAFLIVGSILSSTKLLTAYKELKSKETPTEITYITSDILSKHQFSKNQKNVIIFICDMFNSEYISDIRKEYSLFDEQYKDFVWYRDTLSISGWTVSSMPSLMLGEGYTLADMNSQEDSVNVFFSESSNILNRIVNSHGYDYSNISVSAESDYSPYAYEYARQNNINFNQYSKINLAFFYPIFMSLPQIMKMYIYDNGNWLSFSDKKAIEFNRNNALKSLSYLELLPTISSKENKNPRFFMMRTELSHTPYGIDSDMNVIQNTYPDTVNKSFTSGVAAYYSGKKTIMEIGKFIDWLKDNELYDNSLIVICSDHGNNCYDNGLDNFADTDEEKIYFSRANSLFMIKKPGEEHDEFTVNTSEMYSNADIPYVISSVLGWGEEFQKHTQENEDGKPIRYFYYAKDYKDFNKSYTDYVSYKVTGTMFKKDSWEKIKQ